MEYKEEFVLNSWKVEIINTLTGSQKFFSFSERQTWSVFTCVWASRWLEKSLEKFDKEEEKFVRFVQIRARLVNVCLLDFKPN